VSEASEQLVARALHSVRLHGPALADRTAVVGRSPLALATLSTLLARGVGKVALIAADGAAASAAVAAGATALPPPADDDALAEVHRALGGHGADVVFECDGSSDSRRLAIQLARPAGLIVLVAENPEPVEMSPNLLVFGDKRVQGSRGHTDEELVFARELLAAGRLPISAVREEASA